MKTKYVQPFSYTEGELSSYKKATMFRASLNVSLELYIWAVEFPYGELLISW